MVVFGVFEISEKNVPPKIDLVAIPGVGSPESALAR